MEMEWIRKLTHTHISSHNITPSIPPLSTLSLSHSSFLPHYYFPFLLLLPISIFLLRYLENRVHIISPLLSFLPHGIPWFTKWDKNSQTLGKKRSSIPILFLPSPNIPNISKWMCGEKGKGREWKRERGSSPSHISYTQNSEEVPFSISICRLGLGSSGSQS